MEKSYLIQLSPDIYRLIDHGGGFDKFLRNKDLDTIENENATVILSYIIEKSPYKFNFVFDKEIALKFFKNTIFNGFKNYIHPKVKFKNFLCSFNGSTHVSRQLLTSCLHKFGLFNPSYCSKNFISTIDEIDGHIQYYCENEQFYRKFFIDDNSEDFLQKVYSFGHVRFDHAKNIYNLQNKLTESFIHITSETMATSYYYPFVTEKFFYSIVTRGLFLFYAQPNWHSHIEKYFGFKKYDKLFDYHFDSIINPVERLVELITMISKFRHLSYDDLYNLYLMELDTINYNYDHFFSGQHLKFLQENFYNEIFSTI